MESATVPDQEREQDDAPPEAPVEPSEAQEAPSGDAERVASTDVEVYQPGEWSGGPSDEPAREPAQGELPNMPAPPWLPKLDGHSFRHVVLAFSGGADFDITDETDSRRVKALKLDHSGEVGVSFRVKGKGHTVTYDRDGLPVKALKITLEVDSIEWDDTPARPLG